MKAAGLKKQKGNTEDKNKVKSEYQAEKAAAGGKHHKKDKE